MPFLGHFFDSYAIPSLGILPSPLHLFRCLNVFARKGVCCLSASEALQKGEGGWTAFCYPSLPYFISPFVERRPSMFYREIQSYGSYEAIGVSLRKSCG